MKKLLLVGLSLAATALMSGCGSTTASIAVSQSWYDVYGNSCGNLRPGCDYKDAGFTSAKAQWTEDPFYSPFTQAQFATVFDTDYGYYTDSYGYFGVNGIFYDYYTGRAINEGASQLSKDILTVEGNREEDFVQTAGKTWAAKYNLDVATGVKVARALNDWNRIVATRERTDQDLADFTKRVTGLNINDIKTALSNQDQAQMDVLVGQAAQTWNTSPENMKTIIKTIYKNDIP